MTLNEHSDMALAMFEKECETLEIVRSIKTDIINFSGMGAGKNYSPQEVLGIPLIDYKNITLPIRSIEEALKLLKEFE